MQIGVDSQRAVENRRIFVVAEDEITRAALQFMLLDEYETHEFAGLDEAFAKAAGNAPDLIILGPEHGCTSDSQPRDRVRRQWPAAAQLQVGEPPGAGGSATEPGIIIPMPLRVESVRSAVAVALDVTAVPAPTAP
jgi:hypothetical protein